MVKIYTIENCIYCTELKNIFIEEGVEFISVDVNLKENEDEYNQIYKITNSDDVPIIKIGNQLLIPNVSFSTIREGYEITKKILSEQ